MNPVFIIKNQKFEDKESFANYVKSLGNGIIEIIVKKKKRSRTTGKIDELGNQNGWYRGVICPISSKALGYTEKEIHKVFLAEFAPYIYKDFGNKKVAIRITTSEMDTIQMMEYCNSIIIKMAEMGIIIPEPVKIK